MSGGFFVVTGLRVLIDCTYRAHPPSLEIHGDHDGSEYGGNLSAAAL